MIVIAATVHIHPDKREQALALAHNMMSNSLAEPGCISYRFYADIDDPNRFFLFEEWESEEALQNHLAAPAMQDYHKQFPPLRSSAWTVSHYEVRKKEDRS